MCSLTGTRTLPATWPAALLSSGCLILNVYSRGSFLDEQFCQRHDSGETAMTSVSIRDDGSQKVGICDITTLCPGRCKSFLTLLTVMEELGHKKLVHFVRDSVLLLINIQKEKIMKA